MKAGLSAPWANSDPDLRREPEPSEISGGFPCGPLDLELFNELMFRSTSGGIEIANAVSGSGQTPNSGTLTQLWTAIKGTGTIGNPGYWKTPIGLIFQWDLVTLGTGNGDVVTLPIAFPNDIFLVVATDSGAGAHGLAWSRNGGSVSTFKGYGRDPVTSGAFITTAYGYIAIGF